MNYVCISVAFNLFPRIGSVSNESLKCRIERTIERSTKLLLFDIVVHMTKFPLKLTTKKNTVYKFEGFGYVNLL